MREFLLIIANYLLFLTATILLGGAQSGLWLHIFGYSPAPYLWIAVLNYWALYRSFYESVFMSYLISYVLLTMSGVPLGMAYAIVLTVLSATLLLKDRVLWSGSNSFLLACALSAIITPLAGFIWSQVLEVRPLRSFQFYDFIVRTLLTSAFSFPLYYLFSWMDRLTNKEPPKNTESEVI